MESTRYLGNQRLRVRREPVRGRPITLDGEPFYRIANYDRMRPFFMTVVSPADHWLFISSNGGLTAGRGDANRALFPYYTDDKIRDQAGVTGSRTLLWVRGGGRLRLWEPFSDCADGIYRVQRNLYKNLWGNQLVFEEINQDLGLVFRYRWACSERFGFVRSAWLINSGTESRRVRLLDGLQNLMPSGTTSQFNLEYSTLLDAYKRNELVDETGLGLIRLSAIPVDRPEPAEALETTVAWSVGLNRRCTLLSSVQLERFRAGQPLEPETDIRAERGAYFVQADVSLGRGERMDWLVVADVNQSHSDVARINDLLRRPARLKTAVARDVDHGTTELQRIVAGSDGLQQGGRALGCARHYGNTLFNIMRGGVFTNGYRVDRQDLRAFIRNASPALARRHAAFLRRGSRGMSYSDMVRAARRRGDPQLERVCREYLPLTFSRRHGDPSRPWNRFSIVTRTAEGLPRLNYEGNWRDIFQNWEALAVSFPNYTSGMVCRFLNASTADGYNPYRITRDGIDWEVEDPQDPWSYIGYWGDHQIIYLLKLLELLRQHEPATLQEFLSTPIFAYANVPYRIKPYAELLADPKDTVRFDARLQDLVSQRVQRAGADGKLVWDPQGRVRLVNLTEKLLVPLLAKLSNFIPGAGIWLNTQRPEWNDANNALVGNGTSMVTLCHLRRYLVFCRTLFRDHATDRFKLSAEVKAFLRALENALKRHRRMLDGNITDAQRRTVLDALGRAGSDYRRRLYRRGLSGRTGSVTGRQLLDFLDLALAWIEQSVRSNRRPDGLYHAYNLVRLERRAQVPIRRLYEMLEGQVAVLTSGLLSPRQSLRLLERLRHSRLYRPDQHSYLLYPDRDLPKFLDRNRIPPGDLRRSPLLQRLLEEGNRDLIQRDVDGHVHFHPGIRNGRDVRRILDRFASTRYARLAGRDAAFVLDLFERLFDHQSFTGRSGTFFGYEGLGCIYWHMVSKLLLAAQECYLRALDSGARPDVLKGLADRYDDIRAGIGDFKAPDVYGAFPMDAYSHTPGHTGVRQPGLTGQVKEDLLCRWGELGVRVDDGEIRFSPALLRPDEFLKHPADFHYVDVAGRRRRWRLKPGELAFTYCQVPVRYRLADRSSLTLIRAGGKRLRSGTLRLDAATSRAVFDRRGDILRIELDLARDRGLPER